MNKYQRSYGLVSSLNSTVYYNQSGIHNGCVKSVWVGAGAPPGILGPMEKKEKFVISISF